MYVSAKCFVSSIAGEIYSASESRDKNNKNGGRFLGEKRALSDDSRNFVVRIQKNLRTIYTFFSFVLIFYVFFCTRTVLISLAFQSSQPTSFGSNKLFSSSTPSGRSSTPRAARAADFSTIARPAGTTGS